MEECVNETCIAPHPAKLNRYVSANQGAKCQNGKSDIVQNCSWSFFYIL